MKNLNKFRVTNTKSCSECAWKIKINSQLLNHTVNSRLLNHAVNARGK